MWAGSDARLRNLPVTKGSISQTASQTARQATALCGKKFTFTHIAYAIFSHLHMFLSETLIPGKIYFSLRLYRTNHLIGQ